MELLHERCAALDIGKKDLKACVRTPSPKGKRSRRQEIRTFATTTNALLELRDWLVQGLGQLPVEQRLAVELCYELGYSCEEISAIMGCPVNTVKTRLFHARAKLQKLLPVLGGSAAPPAGSRGGT